MSNEIAQNGWTAVPVDTGKIFKNGTFIHQPQPILVDEITFPQDSLVAEIQKYAQEHLTRQCFHHSMRVFYFGEQIQEQLDIQIPTDIEKRDGYFTPTISRKC